MKATLSLFVGLSLASPVASAATHLDDYATGMTVSASPGHPLTEVQLPDIVYRTITRADLADIRVFNADGIVVPHALCESPGTAAPVVTQESLPVFDLQAAAARRGREARIDINVPSGAEVRIVQEGPRERPEKATRTRAHVIDARSITDALRSIQFEWHSPDGASEAHVRIDASDDLDQWRTVVPASTLLRVTQAGQQLRRERIPLPEQRYRYLRVARADRGPPLQIAAVMAERVKEPESIAPVWFTADSLASSDSEVLFDAARLAPVTYARLHLPQDNMSVRVHLQSRSNLQAQWHDRWSGEAYAIVANGERRISPPAHFRANHDRYWRVRYAASSVTPATPPTLELGYRPTRLRFLAQGSGPFTLAFGSRRAEAATGRQCASLLADVPSHQLEQFVGVGSLGSQRILGGNLALRPLPKETPVRLIVLWAVLVGGVALLIAMALALLKRVGGKDGGSQEP